MERVLLPIFLSLWFTFALVLLASVFFRPLRSLAVILMVLSLAVVIAAAVGTFHRAFPARVEEYAVEKLKRVLVGNGPRSHLLIFNRKSDDPHLEILLGKDCFSTKNLSEKRRVEVDGLSLDQVRLKGGESLRAAGENLVFLGTKLPLPFSPEVSLQLGEKFTHRFLLNSRLRVKRGKFTWILTYIPPSLLGINLLFWELLLAILLSFTGLFFLFRGFYLTALGIFLGLAGAFLPHLILAALPVVVLAALRERRRSLFLLIMFFALPLIFPGRLGVEIKDGHRPVHFKKSFPYGTHRMVLGKTPYLLRTAPHKITVKPLGTEGFRRKFKRIVYAPVKIERENILYLPFPRGFSPVTWEGHRVKLKGENSSLLLSPGRVKVFKFSLPFIILGVFYFLSLALGTDFIVSTAFYFLLTLGAIFVKTAALFDPSFSFISSSHIKMGVLPAGLFFLVLSPGFLPKTRRALELLREGLSPGEISSALKLERGAGVNLFEVLSKPLAGEVLWVDFLFLLSLVLIALQFLMGSETGIRSSGLSLQFFEAGKIFLAVYLADWLFRAQENKFAYPMVLPYALIFLPFLLLIFTLGDFSPLAVFFPAILAHFILVNKPLRKKIPMALAFLSAAGLGIYLSLRFFIPADVALRLKSWLHPGLFSRSSEQFIRAFWLFRSGGFWGNFPQGFINSHSVPLLLFDFPLALFVANFGLAAAGLLLLTCFSLPARLFFRSRTRTYGGRWNFYVLFFSLLVFFSQVLLPFLILTGLLPVMGQPLPFLSKANSDLILFVLPFFLLNLYLLEEGSG